MCWWNNAESYKMSKWWNQNCCSWQFPFCFSQNQSNVTLGPGVPQLTTGRGSQKTQRHHCPIHYGIRYIKSMCGLSQLGCFHGNFVITFLWCFQKKRGDKANKANVEDYEWPHILVLRGYFPYPILRVPYSLPWIPKWFTFMNPKCASFTVQPQYIWGQ